MPELVLTCPYCSSDQMSFTFRGQYNWDREPGVWSTFWVCRKCEEGVVVNFGGEFQYSPGDCAGDICDAGFAMLDIHPKSQQDRAPDHVPEGIARDFSEALDNLRRQNWTSAGMMFRKVLQRSTSEIAPEDANFKDFNLFERINALEAKRRITPAMRDWAHNIRLQGNDATHEEDEEFSEQRACEMKDFAELFLIYAFTLPERIKASNTAAESED